MAHIKVFSDSWAHEVDVYDVTDPESGDEPHYVYRTRDGRVVDETRGNFEDTMQAAEIYVDSQ